MIHPTDEHDEQSRQSVIIGRDSMPFYVCLMASIALSSKSKRFVKIEKNFLYEYKVVLEK